MEIVQISKKIEMFLFSGDCANNYLITSHQNKNILLLLWNQWASSWLDLERFSVYMSTDLSNSTHD